MYNFIIMYPLILISFLVSLLCFAIYTIRRRFRHHHIYNHSPTDHIVTLNTNHSIPNNNNNNNIYKNNNKTTGDEEREKKKKKKKRRKKKQGLVCDHELVKEDKDLVCCLYPFTWSSSATQRRIKQQYDQLVKSHESNGLTLLQVGQFVNCLIEAENELKHKSGVIHRKFTITKALLIKADRSSFDRLRQQIYKLELEQKRLEEDACVYNWLQQQFKLSPAYKKMLEVGAYVESKAKSVDATEDSDSDIFDISFEELLAKEKKDSFWKKKGKPKSGSR